VAGCFVARGRNTHGPLLCRGCPHAPLHGHHHATSFHRLANPQHSLQRPAPRRRHFHVPQLDGDRGGSSPNDRLRCGISWIIEGVLALTESGFARSQGWAIFLGIISVLAGISVLAVPAWSAALLIMFTGISLVITGVSSLARAFTFGKDVLKAMDARGVDIIDGEIID